MVGRIRLETGTQADEATRKKLLDQGLTICAAFRRLFEMAVDDGKALQVLTDAELAFNEIFVSYYRKEIAFSDRIFRTLDHANEKGFTASRPKEKGSSRKRRQRA
jgi:hypothetical protein